MVKNTYFKQFSQIEKTLEQEGRQWHEISPSEEATIRAIAQGSTKMRYDAEAILYLAYGEEYPLELPQWPSFLTQSSSLLINFKSNNYNPQQTFGKLYPNPTSGFLTMDYQLKPKEQALLSIYNLDGKLVWEKQLGESGLLQLHVHELANGVYLYQVSNTTEVLLRDKLVIIK